MQVVERRPRLHQCLACLCNKLGEMFPLYIITTLRKIIEYTILSYITYVDDGNVAIASGLKAD